LPVLLGHSRAWNCSVATERAALVAVGLDQPAVAQHCNSGIPAPAGRLLAKHRCQLIGIHIPLALRSEPSHLGCRCRQVAAPQGQPSNGCRRRWQHLSSCLQPVRCRRHQPAGLGNLTGGPQILAPGIEMPAARFEACERRRLAPPETSRRMLRKRAKQLARPDECRSRLPRANRRLQPATAGLALHLEFSAELRGNLDRSDASASCARSAGRDRF